ncbi:hypothetical protein BDV18DRAFT_156711 [Aspergillus unguis]
METHTGYKHPHETTHEQSRNRKSETWSAKLLDTWLYEATAILFSAGCFIAVICILSVYNGKPAPSFSYGVTLNAIVSILATASKSALVFVIGECIGQLKWLWFYTGGTKGENLNGMQLFDSASRGPLGALTVLFQHRGRSLVSLGALITILALPFDPFMQQILTYPMRNTMLEHNATIAPAKQAVSFFQDALSEDLETVVYTGQWSSEFSLNPTCPSGNCTWPVFRSVEMCNRCEDITDSVTLDCPAFTDINGTGLGEGARHECELRPDAGDRGYPTFETWSASNAGEATASYRLTAPQHLVWAPMTGVLMHAMLNTTNRDVFAGITDPVFVLAHAEFEQINGTSPAGLSPFKDLGKVFRVKKATQCALSLCSRTYTLSVRNGATNLETSEPDFGGLFFVDTLNRSGKGNGSVFADLPDNLYTGPREQSLIVDGVEACWKPDTNKSPTANVTATKSGRWVNEAEQAFCPIQDTTDLQGFLAGDATMWYEIDVPRNGSDVPDWQFLSYLYEQDSHITGILKFGLEATMRKIAASITKSNLKGSNTTVDGTVYRAEVYVKVNWPWIVLPIVLMVLGVVFLLCTMLVNKKRGLKLWKTSLLAVLFHGLEDPRLGDDAREEVEDRHGTVSLMEKTADVKVRLKAVDRERGLMLNQI